MLETRKIFAGELRVELPTKLHVSLLAFFLLTSLTVPLEAYSLELQNVSVERDELDLVEKDVFTVYIGPPLEQISAECVPLDRSSAFDLSVSTNYTDPYFGRSSVVWLKPASRGRYNLTITFQSDKIWDYALGVYAQVSDFYLDLYGKNVRNYGSFLQLRGPYTRLSGNWTINIILYCQSRSRSIFTIELPTPVNSMILVAAVGLIAYLNVFLFLDSYFKNKREMVSTKRWVVLGIVVVLSGLAIYQLYSFTTFVLPGGA